MENRYQTLLSTGLKSRIAQYNEDQIIKGFNQIQNLIDDYKIAIQYFLEEEKYTRIYHKRVGDFYKKILNPHQLSILAKLQSIDNQFPHIRINDRLNLRVDPNKQGAKKLEGGGAVPSLSQIKSNPNQKIFRQILGRYASGETKLKSFYMFLYQSQQMFKDLQSLLDPEKYTKIKDVLFFKEMIQKTDELIAIFQSILDMESNEIYYHRVIELQNLIWKRLKDYIKTNKKNLQKSV